MANVLPTVTIGIPFFNAEESILDTVKSVFAQTHINWELILLDDGSTDRTLEMVNLIDDPRVRVISDGRNKGLAARLNEMAQLARFPYIARMDADDIMSRDRIERQLRFLVENTEFDLVSAGVISVSKNWVPTGLRCVPEDHIITSSAVLAGRSGIAHAAVLGRREWFLRNPYNELLRLGEDADLWIRAYAKGDLKVKVMQASLYFYNEDGNVSHAKLQKAYRIHRRTLVRDASGFNILDRTKTYGRSIMKSFIVFALNASGRLNILRQRRNATSLTASQMSSLAREITEIRSVSLPIKSDISAHNRI